MKLDARDTFLPNLPHLPKHQHYIQETQNLKNTDLTSPVLITTYTRFR